MWSYMDGMYLEYSESVRFLWGVMLFLFCLFVVCVCVCVFLFLFLRELLLQHSFLDFL